MSMTVSIRIGSVRAGGYKGQRTHDLRQGKVPDYVDQDRSGLNRGDDTPTLAKVHEMNVGQKHAAKIATRARYEAAQASGDDSEIKDAKAAKNACRQAYSETGVVAYRGILTFGTEAQKVIKTLSPEDLERFVRESVIGAADVVDTSVFGIRLHLDESAPHAHFYWLATNEQGRKINPDKYDCRKIQDLAAEPFKDLGLTRGKNKDLWIEEGAEPSKYINESVKELHERLPADLAKARQALEEAQEAAIAAQRERDDMRAQLDAVTQERASVEVELQAKAAELLRLEAIQAKAQNLAKSKFPGRKVEVVTDKGLFSTKTKEARMYTAEDLDTYGKAIATEACSEVDAREKAVGARERRIGQELGHLRQQTLQAKLKAEVLNRFAEHVLKKHPGLAEAKLDQVVKYRDLSTGQMREATKGTVIEDQVKMACDRVEKEQEKRGLGKACGISLKTAG